jgi:small subunit ribosomal protein S6
MGRSGVLQRDYEVTFVLNATIDEEASAAAVERVNHLIDAGGGSVTEVHSWGRRRLAYPIAHHRDGVYVTTRFAMPTLALTAFENDLRLNESILRHLVVRQDEVPIRPILPAATVPAGQAAIPPHETAEPAPDHVDVEDMDVEPEDVDVEDVDVEGVEDADVQDITEPDLIPPADE